MNSNHNNINDNKHNITIIIPRVGEHAVLGRAVRAEARAVGGDVDGRLRGAVEVAHLHPRGQVAHLQRHRPQQGLNIL